MSLLIKGMEMPKDGVYWCEIGVADDIAMITIHGEDRKSFHLVPVPPHKRLIDADALTYIIGMDEHFSPLEAMYLMGLVVDAPTIIPADKDGET